MCSRNGNEILGGSCDRYLSMPDWPEERFRKRTDHHIGLTLGSNIFCNMFLYSVTFAAYKLLLSLEYGGS